MCFYLKALLNHLDVVKHALHGTVQVADIFEYLVAPTDQDPQTTTLRFQIKQVLKYSGFLFISQ